MMILIYNLYPNSFVTSLKSLMHLYWIEEHRHELLHQYHVLHLMDWVIPRNNLEVILGWSIDVLHYSILGKSCQGKGIND